MTNGRDRRLIHADSHFAASSPDMSLAGVVAAVIVERGQPRQGCDGLAREQAQLLQVDKQYAGHLRPDARDGLQNLVACLKDRGIFDEPI